MACLLTAPLCLPPCLCRLQYFQLRKARDMLSMFVNRANGGWTEAQKWEPPDVASSGDVLTWTKTDQFAIYKADAM
eukprot:scaffold89051_cov14-Tisochrysis_lutea.AAC.1